MTRPRKPGNRALPERRVEFRLRGRRADIAVAVEALPSVFTVEWIGPFKGDAGKFDRLFLTIDLPEEVPSV